MFNLVKITFSIFLLVYVQNISHAHEVTLKDAYQAALEKTEGPQIAQTKIDQLDAKMSQAKSKFLPSLSFVANFQEQDASGTTPISSSFSRLTLSQSLFEGGRDLDDLKSLESSQEASRQSLTASNYTTFIEVAKQFYAILSNQTEIDNIKKIMSLAQNRLTEINKRERIGRSRNIDQLAAKAQLSVLEAQLMAAEGSLNIAWQQFVLITGLPKEVTLIKKREIPEAPKDINFYLSNIEKRPDVAMIKSQLESADYNMSASKAGHYPSLNLLGNYYLKRDGFQKDIKWDVGLTLSFPIFAGGLVSAQVSEASFKLKESELLLAQTKRQAEIAIRSDYNNLISLLNQTKALESALKSTEANYKEQEKNYRFGQATNLDVIQALNSYQDTKRTLDKTKYLSLSAWASLKASSANVTLATFKGTP